MYCVYMYIYWFLLYKINVALLINNLISTKIDMAPVCLLFSERLDK